MGREGLISVIIPCYNVAKYLSLIAEDLKRQSYGNYEAIFINDGDDSLDALLDEIRNSDKRFKVYKKKNGGVSSARNVGLDKAAGEWVTFVDPDDRLEESFLQSLYDATKGEDVDYVIGGYNSFDGHNTESFYLQDATLDFGEFFSYIEDNVYFRAPWSKMFKREIVEENNLRFDERFSRCEDWIFILGYYLCIKEKVGVIGNCGYTYQVGNLGNLSDKYDPNHVQSALMSIELLSAVRKKVGRTKEQVNTQRDRDHTALCFSMLKNLYCTRSHPSLLSSIQIIKKELLGNEELINALKRTEVHKLSDRIQKRIILCGPPAIIAILHKILYVINHRIL